MGRTIQGNTASAASLKLTSTLGALSATATDSTTVSAASWAWGTFQTNTSSNAAAARNTAGEQRNNNYCVFQDPIQAYNLVQSNVTGSGLRAVIFDDSLNLVRNLSAAMSSGTLIAVRLYDGVLYQIGVNGAQIRVEATVIATGVMTAYTQALSFTADSTSLVFNWPVNGKFYILAASASSAAVYTFDLAARTFAATSSWSGSSLSSLVCMHVKSDGSACSVACYANSTYGVLHFPATGSASYSGYSGSGHTYWYIVGGYYVFGGNVGNNIAITEACAIDFSNLPGYTGATTYRRAVMHLAGGDTNVVLADHAGPAGASTYPFDSLTPVRAKPNNAWLLGNLNNTGALIRVGRTGTTLTLTADGLPGSNTSYDVSCALVGVRVAINAGNTEPSAYVSNLSAMSYTGRSAAWGFAASVIGKNYVNYGISAHTMAFVTRTGRFFFMGWHYSSAATTANFVTGQVPVFFAPKAANYNATVIGAGGSSVTSSPVHGGSSSIAGISAASGQNRVGGRSGSQIITSGPLAGTCGAGYYDEKFGQGEDATAAAQYGGGSGYRVTAQISVAAGEVVPYVAGIGPQYGGQGVIVLEEI